MPIEIIPVADLATVTPGDNDFVVGSQNGEARKFPAARFLATAAQALAGSGVFDTTAAGLAATTSGQYFSVPGADADDYLILYRNNAGSAVEVKRYPSVARVDAVEAAMDASLQQLADETEGYRAAGDPIQPALVGGWAWNVMDADGKVAIGVLDDGTFSAKEISAEGMTGLQNLAVGDTTIGQADAADYAWTVEDAEGKIALGVRRDGAVAFGELVNPPAARPDRFGGGLFQHQINYINGTGQSLGYGAGPVQTTAQEYDNLVFGGLKPLDPENFQPAFRGDGEDPRFGTMGHVKELLLEENGITWQINDYQLLSANNAVSAMGIDALSEGGSTGAYEAAVSQVSAGVSIAASLGKSFAFRAVTWTQGEADAGMSKATYKSKVMALANNFNADGKAITGQTQDVIFITYQVSSNFDKAVGVAQWEAAQESPLIYLATPMYFFTYIDGQHITGDSTKWLGGYYGLVYKRVVIDGLPWEPLQPRSISALGNNIDIVFNKDGLVFDTTMMPAVANMGFTVVNAALADQTISSVTILPGNRVRLAMAGAPAAGWKVRYAHNVVTGKAEYSSGGGNLRDRQGERITYHNHPMHNWCVMFDWEI